MGFGSNSTPSVDFKLQEAKQREQLRAELNTLGAAIEQAQATLDEFTVTNTDLERAKNTLAKIQEELEAETFKQKQLDEAKGEFATTQTAIGKAKTELAGLKTDCAAATKELVTVTDAVNAMKAEASKQHDVFTKAQSERQTALALLDTTIETAEDKMAALSKQIDALAATKAELESHVETLKESASQASKQLAEMNTMLEDGKVALDKLKADHATQIATLTKAYEAKKAAQEQELEDARLNLAEREGTVSNRESWLEEKQKRLQRIKSELEKESGRKINITI